MSTLRISNIEAKSVPASATVDEKVKITNSSGDTLVFIDGKTSGITTVGINTTDGNIKFDANSNVVVTGIITATKFSGQFEPTSVGIADSIFHTGDDNTSIRFPANDTITAETSGGERLRIHSDGKLSLGTSSSASAKFNISHGNELALYTSGPYNYQAKFESTDAEAAIVIEDVNSGSNYNRIGVITNDMTFITNNNERLRITSAGDVGIGTAVPVVASNYGNLSLAGNTGGQLELKRLSNDTIHYIWGNDNLNIAGGYANGSSSSIKFYVNGASEKLRIDTSGNLFLRSASTNYLVMGSSGDATSGGITNNMNWIRGNSTNTQYNTAGGFHAFEVSGSEKFRINNTGDVSIPDGNLIVASGHGIDFSATGGPTNGTGTSELLDDYEEGDINVNLVGQYGGSISYSYRVGRYIKIGSLVHFTGDIRLSGGWSGNSGNVYIQLPFTSYGTGGTVGNGIVAEWNLGNSNWDSLMLQVDNNAANARITTHSGSNNNTSHLQTGELGNNRYLKFGVTYHTHL